MTFDTDSRLSRTVSSTATRGTTTRIVRGGSATVAMVRGVLLWRRVQRLTSTAWRVTTETVTAAGWLVVSAAILGLVVGLAFGWVEFVAIALAALVAIACSIPFLFGAKAYRVSLNLERDRIVVGQEATGNLAVTNIGSRLALPGIVDVPVGEGILDIHVPMLRREASHEEPLRIPGKQRGVITIGPASTVRSDPLALFRRQRTWDDAHTLFIHPETTRLPSTSTGFIRDLEGNPSRTIVSDDLSFHAIREYEPGDSRRHIHWKSTAKTGTLMVRQYEETRRSEMVVALASRGDEYRNPDEFELAVSATGSLGLRALQDGRDLRVNLSDEVPELVRHSVGSLQELNVTSPRNLLDELSGVTLSDQRHGLTEVAALASERWAHASIAFLVAGSGVNTTVLQRAALTFPSNVAVLAVICDLHAEPGMWTIGNSTVLTIGIIDDLRGLLLKGGGYGR